MRFGLWVLVAASFIAGLLTATTLIEGPQLPRSPLQLGEALPSGAERAGPQDRISESQIIVLDDRVEMRVDNPKWATFADTNSMDPVLDTGSNAIQIEPTHPQEIKIGDIITYNLDGRHIIHRVVDIQQDAQGHYYTVKGDNNAGPDPVKVRFEDIERVVVAIIY